jgi:predicted MFS family arabinose efflux permease
MTVCPTCPRKRMIFFIAVLTALLLALLSCATSEPYPYQSVERTPTNEKCRVFRNWGVSDGEFMRWVHWMIEGTQYEYIRTLLWNGAGERRGRIISAVVYYE